MSLVWHFIDFCLHLDTKLPQLAESFGPWLYVIMFAVIFCETGLVVTPLLPGDSLLFAFGAVAARDGSRVDLFFSVGLLIAAAIAGDAVNYTIGALLGPKVFHYERSRFLNKKHLVRTHEFYERHGGKTIVLVRFIPIVRTFAPFVAGIADGLLPILAIQLRGGRFMGADVPLGRLLLRQHPDDQDALPSRDGGHRPHLTCADGAGMDGVAATCRPIGGDVLADRDDSRTH